MDQLQEQSKKIQEYRKKDLDSIIALKKSVESLELSRDVTI